jgi:penicillin-binding protein 1A
MPKYIILQALLMFRLLKPITKQEKIEKGIRLVTDKKHNPFLDPYLPYGEDESPRPEEDTNHGSVLKAKPSIMMIAIRITVVCSFIIGTAFTVGAGFWLREIGFFNVQQSRLQILVDKKLQDNSIVYDRNNEKIGEFFNSYHVYVPFKKIPKHLVNAIISIEDRDFWNHRGIDPKGMLRAAFSYLKSHSYKQGASTITQQVVRNFILSREKTLQRKFLEIRYAIELEKVLSKEKIIEIYANSLFLGNGSYGIGAAAFRYFGKSIDQIQPHESALLAGLFQSPSRYNPARHPKVARKRQIRVLKSMYKAGHLRFAEAKKLMGKRLRYKKYKPFNQEKAPYFVDHVKTIVPKLLSKVKGGVKNSGLRIFTTIDMNVQKMAEKALADSKDLLKKGEDHTALLRRKRGWRKQSKTDKKSRAASLEAAVLSVDPRNGHIMAMVGGRNYKGKSQYNRTTQAMRSPGSAFKPIVYSYALENRYKWSDVLFVAPINIGNYKPRTPTKEYLSETTILRAFYRSMNTPTIELGQKLGLKPIINYAKKLGIRSPIKEEFGTLLGSSDVNMMDLARVYSSFANSGKQVEPMSITRIEDRDGKILYEAPSAKKRTKRVMTPQIAYLMTQGMRSVLQMGTGYKSAHLSGRAAGKTGTSNDSSDNWFCGYTRNLVSIVWVGTDEHVQIHGHATGGKYALPIWDKLMSSFTTVNKPLPFTRPRGVVTAVIDSHYGNRSPTGIRMSFLRGNEPKRDEAPAAEALSHLKQAGGGYRDVFTH